MPIFTNQNKLYSGFETFFVVDEIEEINQKFRKALKEEGLSIYVIPKIYLIDLIDTSCIKIINGVEYYENMRFGQYVVYTDDLYNLDDEDEEGMDIKDIIVDDINDIIFNAINDYIDERDQTISVDTNLFLSEKNKIDEYIKANSTKISSALVASDADLEYYDTVGEYLDKCHTDLYGNNIEEEVTLKYINSL